MMLTAVRLVSPVNGGSILAAGPGVISKYLARAFQALTARAYVIPVKKRGVSTLPDT